MIILNNKQKLQISLLSNVIANELDVIVYYRDNDDPLTGKYQRSKTKGIILVDICSSPNPTVVRYIAGIRVIQNDILNAIATIHFNDSGINSPEFVGELSQYDVLQYSYAISWNCLDRTSSIKGVGATGPPGAGITDINSDPTLSQTLTTGTSGTDFNIVDDFAGDHKFNIPTASAVNRGLLSSADWITFNNGKTLAQTLAAGNTTGQNDIILSNITGDDYTLKIKSPNSKSTIQFWDNATDGWIEIRGSKTIFIGTNTGNNSAINFTNDEIQLNTSDSVLAKNIKLNGTTMKFEGLAPSSLSDDKVLIVNSVSSKVDYISGASGSFISADAKTITVLNGVITSIV